MGKNYTKIFKILEHLGEGTISEIENKIKDEDKIIEDIKADLGIEEENELNLDEILKEDLEAISETPIEEESLKSEEFPEIGIEEKETKEEEEKTKTDIIQEPEISENIPEKENEEIGIEETETLDLSSLEENIPEEIESGKQQEEFDLSSIEEAIPEVKEEKNISEELESETLEEKPEEEIDLNALEESIGKETETPIEEESVKEEKIEKKEAELEPSLPEEEAASTKIEEQKPEEAEEEIEKTESISETENIDLGEIEAELAPSLPEKEKASTENEEQESESIEDLNLEEDLDLGELEEKIEPEIESTEEEGIDLGELENIEAKPEVSEEKIEGIPESEKDEFIDLSDLQEIAGISEEEHEEELQDISISEDDLEIIKNTLKNDYPVWLSKEIKNLILNDALAVNELQTLIDLIVSGANYKDVEKYLEKTLNIKVRPSEVEEKVYIPSTYEVIFPYIKWATISIFTLFLLGVITFYFIYIPSKAKSYYNLGYKYLEKNKIEEAQKYYNIAINYKIYPEQILRYGKKYFELGYYKIAEEKIKYGIALKPNDIRFYFALSDVYFAQKLYDKSIKLLENLYANVKFSKNPQLYLEIGKKYEMLKQYQDAISTYVEGIRNVGANKDIYFKLLDDSIITENLKASEKVYNMIFSLNEKLIDDRIFTDYAALLLKNKKDFEAIKVMDRIKKHNKYYAPVYYYYGIYYKNRRKPDEALANLKFAEQIINLGYADKKFLDKIYNFIGEIYLDKGDKYYPESYNYFNKAIAENPDNPKPYYNLAKIYYFYTNQYEIALKNLLTAERLGYTDDRAEYMKGWIFYKIGNYNNAIKRFVVLQQKYINNINLKLAVGNTFIKLKKPELAIGFLESIISYWENQKRSIKFLNIENPDIAKIFINLSVAYNNLGVAYQMLAEKTGNTDYSSKALQYFLKSQEEYSKSNANFQVNSEAKINSLYILHPDIKRKLLLMDSKNYFPDDIFNQ